jgi:hypothetical protein
MTTLTVTATQGGATFAGMLLRVKVLTGAAAAASQPGGTLVVTATAAHGNITTTQTGSLVYGALSADSAAGSFAAEPLCTLIDNYNDSAHGEQYGSFRTTSATGTPGSTLVGSSTANANPNCAAAEILQSGTITEDASSPAVVVSNTLTALTTASFTPPPGSLIVVLIGSDGAANGTTTTTMAVTDTGGGLTWIPLAQAASTSTEYAGVWIAQVPAGGAVSGSVQPRATVPVPRRRLARGLWGGLRGRAFVAVPAPRQGPYLPPRRKPARAWIQFTPVRTVNATGIAVPAPRQVPPVPRRVRLRAVWRGSAPFTGFTAVPAPGPRPAFPRRVPSRALWRGLAVPAVRSVAPRQPPYLPPRLPPRRAYVRFTPVVTVNAQAAAVAGTVPALMVNQARPAVRRDGRVVRPR